MNNIEKAVLDQIDFDGLLQALDRLVKIPSLDGSTGEVQVQAETAVLMRSLGLDVETWEIDLGELQAYPAYTAAQRWAFCAAMAAVMAPASS